MTMTVDEAIASVEGVLAQLRAVEALAAAPLAAGALPPHVAAGDLITSAWGNAVVDVLTATDAIYAGSCPGGTVAAGGQAQVATITLPQGVWALWYQVQVMTTVSLDISVRAFVGGSAWSDTVWTAPVIGAAAKVSAVMHVIADLSSFSGGNAVSFNIINNSSASVSSFADPMNHRLHAMAGRLPA